MFLPERQYESPIRVRITIRPFEILERVGKVANRLALPPAMSGLHDHVSMLRKYIADPSLILKHPKVEITPYKKHEVQLRRFLAEVRSNRGTEPFL